jgi:hypothetical protein
MHRRYNFHLTWDTLGEALDLGLPVRTMATCGAILPLGASFLKQTMVRGGSEVERIVSFRVNNGGPRQLGAVDSRRRTRSEVHMRGGGTV